MDNKEPRFRITVEHDGLEHKGPFARWHYQWSWKVEAWSELFSKWDSPWCVVSCAHIRDKDSGWERTEAAAQRRAYEYVELLKSRSQEKRVREIRRKHTRTEKIL